MTRLKRLKRLYDKIGGISPESEEKYRKLYQLNVNTNLTEKSVSDIFDELADKKFRFDSVKEIIAFEKQVQDEFWVLKTKINNNINNNRSIRILNSYRKHLEDIMETIEKSYLTVDNFENYDKEKYELLTAIEDQNNIYEGLGKLN